MASLQTDPKSGFFYVNWFLGGRQFNKSTRTKDRDKAELILRGVEDRLWKLEQGLLTIPPDADAGLFVLNGQGSAKAPSSLEELVAKPTTLGQLTQLFLESLTHLRKASTTRLTDRIHVNNLLACLGANQAVSAINLEAVEQYVERRSVDVEPTTVEKELETLRHIWKWGSKRESTKNVGLPSWTMKEVPFGKGKEAERFQTMEVIQSRIARGGLSEAKIEALWECLYLQGREINEVLAHVEKQPAERFVYPMLVFVACTGARRSELVASEIDDFDFANQVVHLRERKDDKTKEITFRHVSLHPLLNKVMQDWLAPATHPGGQMTLCKDNGKPLTVDAAHYHLKKALAGSKWEVIKGFHVFRHSFASVLASNGVDQRIINSFVGHDTVEMERRYQHLVPDKKQEAIETLFS